MAWVKCFEECSFDPINRPNVLCDAKKMLEARTIPDVCRAVLEESEGKMLTFDRTRDAAEVAQQKITRALERLDDGKHRPARVTFTCTSIAWERRGDAILPADVRFLFVKFTVFERWDAGLLLMLVVGVGLA